MLLLKSKVSKEINESNFSIFVILFIDKSRYFKF